MKRETKIIDAKDRTLGRLASEIAVILRGKHKPDFLPYKDTGDVVMVKNIRDLIITGRKMQQKKYYHHTGFPGGIKEVSLKKLFKENPAEVLRKAVYGMLPKNRLREEQIKRLKFQNQR